MNLAYRLRPQTLSEYVGQDHLLGKNSVIKKMLENKQVFSMIGKQYFGGIIWTNHALDRLSERGFSQQMAWEAFKYSDKVLPGKDGSTEFHKRFGNSRITTIGKKNDKGEWVVLSCWMDPPLPGTDDHKRRQKYLAYQRSSGVKRWILALLRQLGL